MSFHAPAIKATELLETPPPASECPLATPWMLWWIVGVHLAWGVGLLMAPKALGNIIVLIGVDWIVVAGISDTLLAFMLIVISIMASLGLVLETLAERRKLTLNMWIVALLICPQYFVVVGAFISDMSTLVEGNVNGQTVERWILLSALAPVVWGALLHTAAILERYALVWRRR